MKKILASLAVLSTLALGACTDADVVSENISKAADYFEIPRRIVFYNGITGTYMLELQGFCSLGNFDDKKELSVTCKSGNEYKKHYLGLSDNVTYFAEQLEGAQVSKDHYRVIFNPSVIIPSLEIK